MEEEADTVSHWDGLAAISIMLPLRVPANTASVCIHREDTIAIRKYNESNIYIYIHKISSTYIYIYKNGELHSVHCTRLSRNIAWVAGTRIHV